MCSINLQWNFQRRNLAGTENRGGKQDVYNDLHLIKEEISMAELFAHSGVPQHSIFDIMEGNRELEVNIMCRIVDVSSVCVHELCADEKI